MTGAERGPPRERPEPKGRKIVNPKTPIKSKPDLHALMSAFTAKNSEVLNENRRLRDQVATLAREKNEANDENRRLRAQIVRDEEYLAFLTASDHVHKESVHLVENYRNGIKTDNHGLFS